MKQLIAIAIFCLTTLLLGIGTPHNEIMNAPVPDVQTTGKKVAVAPDFGKIPLYFIANQGQADGQTLFYARTSRYTLWLTKQGMVFDGFKKVEGKVEGRDVSRLIFLNALPNPEIVPGKPADYRVNFLKGNDKSGWHTQVPTSERVCYKNLYNAIDLEVYGVEKLIEYDWVIKPGGNPTDIRFAYQNIKRSFIDETGNLVIQTAFGEWLHKKPVGYQVINGKREAVEIAFTKRGKSPHIYGFKVSRYDKNYELIIDPLLIAFSTYLGGDSEDGVSGIVINGSGSIYATGFTVSTDFPTVNAYQGALSGEVDAFITKYSPDGSSLVYSTYLGGSGEDYPHSIALDDDGAACITGYTYSSDFPTVNPYQASRNGGSDGFIAKISANGSSLLYATYLGGSASDTSYDIAVNSSGEIVVAGQTMSSDFPLQSALQPDFNAGLSTEATDAFVTKFTASGGSLVFSTYLGGSRAETATSLAIDNSGNVYIGGRTNSFDFPTVNAYQSSLGDTTYGDAFIAKMPSNGSALTFSTYLGGNGDETIEDMAINATGIYLTGFTLSTNFPTTANAYQTTKQGDNYYHETDAFVSKFNLSGSSLIYSTFLGANGGSVWGSAIAVGLDGSAHIIGNTISPNFPQVESPYYITISNLYVAFVTRFLPDGSDIDFSGAFCSSWDTSGRGIQVDATGNIYLGGSTSDGFLTYNATQPNYGGSTYEGFIMKLAPCVYYRITVTAPNGGESWTGGSMQNIAWTGPEVMKNVAISYTTDNGDNWTPITESTPNTGSYSWTVPNIDSNLCLINISEAGYGILIPADGSDSNFTITLPPPKSITVTSPNGGETLQASSTHTVTWTSTGAIENVKIDFSGNNGSSWNSIIASTPNTGSYNWVIPRTPSGLCLVRVTDVVEGAFDDSDTTFNIYNPPLPTLEREALIALYNSTNGDSWYDKTNWRNPSNPSEFNDPGTEYTWFGITLSPDENHVSKIELPNNNLANSLPVELNNLTGLTTLTLYDNNLTGALPNLGNLINLETLSLGNNQLTGSVPAWLNIPVNLRVISLMQNQLTGTIPDLSTLTNLHDLRLSNNQLTGTIPSWLNSIGTLEWLKLNDNQLTGAIPNLGNLTNLQWIDFGNNQLTGNIPSELGNLTKLLNLGLRGNQLKGQIPSSLTNLTQLYEDGFSGLLIDYNGLYNNDPNLTEFLLTKAGPWEDYQTVPPAGLSFLEVTENSIQLKWTPIAYRNDPGGYNIYIGTTSGSGYTLVETTTDKEFGYYTITGLNPQTTYYIVVNSYTDPCWGNLNKITSENSTELQVTTSSGTLTLTSPNGGEMWEINSVHPITWMTDGIVNSVKIEYSLDNGNSWNTIIESIPNTGSYNWTLPNTMSDQARVRISDTQSSHRDQSDGWFYLLTDQRSITVACPNGGEILDASREYIINWFTEGTVSNVKIEYSTDSGGSWSTIVESAPNVSGDYSWTVPNTPSATALVRVSDAAGPATDQSDAVFRISELRTLTLTSLNGGESVDVNTVYPITWSHTGFIQNVRILYSTNNGSTWDTIIFSTPNTGSYNWLVPNTISSTVLVAVYDTAGPAFDQSNAVFAIVPLRTITVTAPNGGESWEGATIHTITWNYTGSIPNVKIEYSTNNGTSWNTITASMTNIGSLNWNVANAPSTNCLIKVSDAAGPAVDQSNAVFTILPQRTITVTSPNGGESWMGNTDYPITWTSTGAISYVKIEYSTNNGGSWNTITASIANTGSYGWTVPNSPSTNCLIKVSDTGSLVSDRSNAAFAITPPMIPQSERDALIALYNSTNGDAWSFKYLWRKPGYPGQFNDRGTENTWYGVTCNAANTHVTGIQLPSNWLMGTLPSELNNLPYLTTLDLSSNNIDGTIPNLTGLTQLQDLNLGGNSLDGTIPAWLNTLTNLTKLSLGGNFFTGSIPDLSNLSQLKELSLGANFLTGSIPTWLNNLANLELLSLWHNQFNGTLTDLSGLTKLKTLHLANNQITGDIPAWPNSLTDLETLDLSANTFNGTIANLGGLTKLKTLNFSYNQLPGNIPAWLNNLTALETLDLAANSFSGTIPNLQNLTLLQNLVLGYNQLTGSVPTWINQLSTLKILDLRSNLLSGEIPDLTGMNQLESLVLSQDQLSGAIPGSLNTLPNLKYLYLSSNQLTGTIPNLGTCTALQYLYLDNNQLSGTIPSTLGNLLNLKELNLGINRLSGGIPQEFGSLSNLEILTLKSNQLVGNMPDSLANLVNLKSNGLNLSWNGLYTNNSSLHQFLDSKYANGGACINSTQTVAPTDVRTTYIGRDYVQLEWTPIEFDDFTGGYQVYYSTTPGGDYVLAGTTTDKTVDMFTVSDLTQATQYYFVIKTISQPHTNNQNTIVSDPGTEVSAKTSNPSLYFTYPTGGETWTAGTTHELSWVRAGIIENIKLEYSIDSGNTWITIVESMPWTGTYNWSVPNTPSAACKVRVSETTGLASSVNNGTFTILEQHTLHVTSPNGGEIWEAGNPHPITWTSTGNIISVNISYSTDNGNTWNIIQNEYSNSGTYSWTPTNNISSTNCLIKVSEYGSYWIVDQSDAVFTIKPLRTITVTSPSINGISWEGNTVHPITWTHTGDIPNVKIEYSIDNGGSWNTIIASTPNNNTYDWTVPNTPSTGCLVKVSDVAGPAVDQSNYVFTIFEQRTVTVTTPNGGESWEGTTVHPITWTFTGSIPNVKIEYSINNGGTWNTVIASTANTGSYNWTVTNAPSTNCLVKVTDTAGPASDQSNAVFTILTHRTIYVNSPIGGESWEGNTAHAITWNYTGAISNVKIEYSTNNGSSWNTIIASTANTGSYNWTVANTPSAACLVKVSDIDGPASGQSYAVFTIVAARTITVTSPNGGETWEGTTDHTITWTSTGAIAFVSIQYSTNNGGSWTVINSSASNNGSYSWTVPNSASTTCLVKVKDYAGPAVDQSDTVFTITSHRTIYVTAPFTGDSWEGNTVKTIRWITTGDINNVKIEYSTDNASSWNTITESAPSAKPFGSYDWTVSNTPSTACWVKVSDTAGPATDLCEGAFTIAAQRTITVTSPNGGETWEGNTAQSIAWASSGAISNVKIEYSTNGGSSWNTIAASTANTGSYNWTVPNTPSTDCLVKVTDTAGPASDQSNTVFTIATQRTITVTSPNGGETWEGNTAHTITWTSTGDISNVKLEYSTNNGSSWNTITASTANSGSYNWTVPNTASTDCLVKVNDIDGPALDQSNAVFTIVTERTVTVTAPNGGESWEGNTAHSITWTYTGNIPNVMIEYSTTGGSSWNTITASTANTGAYNWTVPNTPFTTCLVRVSDTTGPASDQSNAVFTILAERTVTVTAPNGGETWEGNNAYSITWTSTGGISNVSLEYSTDSGSSWNTITASTANTGAYNWTVPNTPFTTCLVRVSDTAGPASDQSDTVFTIAAERTFTVTAPNGGESWEGNTAHSITWTSTGNIPNVMIEYSTNSGSSWNTIAASTANTGSYNWPVPNSPSTTCLVKVTDAAGPASDQSNTVFSIAAERTLTVTAPNGGESWEENTSYPVTWTSTGSIANVMIEYSTTGGSSWNTITNSTANSGSYNWTVPNTPSSTCLIKISDITGPASDQSNAMFNIVTQRTITVTSPNGAENLLSNTTYPITWTSTGAISSVVIEYSTNSGSSWNTVTASNANSGSFNWTIPAAASTSCLVKVSDTAGPAYDQSNAVFTISNVTYCSSSGTSQTRGYIARVQVGNLVNSSGSSAYTNFTSLIANLTAGSSTNISLTPSTTNNTEYWKIWIDYNRDGDFADSGENVYSGSGKTTKTGSFTVPTATTKGTGRMRVTMRYNNTPTYCDAFSYGEVEDYTVNIQ